MPVLRNLRGTESLIPDTPRNRANPAADDADAERSRAKTHAMALEKIAAARLAEQRVVEIDADIAGANERKEIAAAEHCAACAPIQAELATIEQAQVEAIRQRRPLGEDRETRRQELLKELQAQNDALAAEISRCDAEIKTLNEARFIEAQKTVGLVDGAALAMQFSSQERQIRLFLARNALRWAEARCSQATDRHVNHAGEMTRAELDAARALLSEARRELAAAEAECLLPE